MRGLFVLPGYNVNLPQKCFLKQKVERPIRSQLQEAAAGRWITPRSRNRIVRALHLSVVGKHLGQVSSHINFLPANDCLVADATGV